MSELFPVAWKRNGAGIPRRFGIPSALVVTVALVAGSCTVGASAEEAQPSASTESTESAAPTDSGGQTTASGEEESPNLRHLAAAAIDALRHDRDDRDSTSEDPSDESSDDAAPPAEKSAPPVEASDPPAEGTDPPVEETDPPVDETDPPVEETDPPVEETDPPVEETDPPVDETDPPVDETDPPVEETDPPAEETDPPADAPVPPAAQTPAPESDPIPVRPRPSARPDPAAEAEAEAAREAAAERAAAVAAAQDALTAARLAYDDAKRDFASATADHDAAALRAHEMSALAKDAEKRAARSERTLGALVRSLAQHGSGNAAAGVILDGRGGDNLLYQLGTLDKLANLTGNVAAIRERAEADRERAGSLAEQATAAQQLVDSIPLEAAKAELDAAKAEFDAASEALAALRTSAPVGLVGLTPIDELLAADTGQLSEQGWAHPAIGRITDHFGPRPERPLPGVGLFHSGTDIGAACNAGIYAATSGVVEAVGSVGTYGNWILIDHGNGIETGYAHVAAGATLVSVGEPVIAGQVIAGVGSTGASTGCHLHFEVRIDGTRVDAEAFMAQRGVLLGAD